MTNSLARPRLNTRSVMNERELARADAAAVTASLSSDSARLVRIERIVRGQSNPADQARDRGFYDYMLGRPSQALALGQKLEVSYAQGWAKGVQRRIILKGRPWYETEKLRDGGKWHWRIYREGYFELQGTTPNERRADQDIEVAKADLMDRYGDWGVRSITAVPAEPSDEDEAAGQRM